MSALAREVVATQDRLDFLLSFRPVYTRSKSVAAYEVLLDNGRRDNTLSLADLAGRGVLGAYAGIYQNGRIENVPNLLRVTPATLWAAQSMSLPRSQYILEIAGDDMAEQGLPEQLRALAHRGYNLALAGYRPDREHLAPLLDVVQVVRLDLREVGLAGLAECARSACFHGAKLLADGVDDATQYCACAELGVTWFQGEFIGEPAPVQGKRIATNKQVLLALLAELRRPDTTPTALEQIAVKDPGLAFRILTVINSAATGLRHQISSLSDAISLLGTDELGRWVQLLLVHGEPGKPDELMRSMLVRGRMCETLATLANLDEPASHFMVGLLSRLDAMMDISMHDLMQQVPLSPAVKQALLHRSGPLGQILAEVERYERGQFDRLTWVVASPLYEVAYRHSVNWARQTQQALGAA